MALVKSVQLFESLSESSAGSLLYTTALTASVQIPTSDSSTDWLILWRADVQGALANNNPINVRARADGTTISLHTHQFTNSTSDWKPCGGVGRVTGKGSSFDVIIDFRSNNASNVMKIRNVQVVAIRTDITGADFQYAENNTEQTNIGTSWATIQTLTWTPATAGNHLVIWCVEGEPENGGQSIETRIEDSQSGSYPFNALPAYTGSGEHGGHYSTGGDNAEVVPQFGIAVINYAASSNTLTMKAKGTDANADVIRTRIAVLSLAGIDPTYVFNSVVGSRTQTPTASTYVNADPTDSAKLTLTNGIDWVVLNSLWVTSNGTTDRIDARLRYDNNGSEVTDSVGDSSWPHYSRIPLSATVDWDSQVCFSDHDLSGVSSGTYKQFWEVQRGGSTDSIRTKSFYYIALQAIHYDDEVTQGADLYVNVLDNDEEQDGHVDVEITPPDEEQDADLYVKVLDNDESEYGHVDVEVTAPDEEQDAHVDVQVTSLDEEQDADTYIQVQDNDEFEYGHVEVIVLDTDADQDAHVDVDIADNDESQDSHVDVEISDNDEEQDSDLYVRVLDTDESEYAHVDVEIADNDESQDSHLDVQLTPPDEEQDGDLYVKVLDNDESQDAHVDVQITNNSEEQDGSLTVLVVQSEEQDADLYVQVTNSSNQDSHVDVQVTNEQSHDAHVDVQVTADDVTQDADTFIQELTQVSQDSHVDVQITPPDEDQDAHVDVAEVLNEEQDADLYVQIANTDESQYADVYIRVLDTDSTQDAHVDVEIADNDESQDADTYVEAGGTIEQDSDLYVQVQNLEEQQDSSLVVGVFNIDLLISATPVILGEIEQDADLYVQVERIAIIFATPLMAGGADEKQNADLYVQVENQSSQNADVSVEITAPDVEQDGDLYVEIADNNKPQIADTYVRVASIEEQQDSDMFVIVLNTDESVDSAIIMVVLDSVSQSCDLYVQVAANDIEQDGSVAVAVVTEQNLDSHTDVAEVNEESQEASVSVIEVYSIPQYSDLYVQVRDKYIDVWAKIGEVREAGYSYQLCDVFVVSEITQSADIIIRVIGNIPKSEDLYVATPLLSSLNDISYIEQANATMWNELGLPLVEVYMLDTSNSNIYGESMKYRKDPVIVPCYIDSEESNQELSQFGMSEDREVKFVFSMLQLKQAGLGNLHGALIYWDGDYYEVLEFGRPVEGYWLNTNIAMLGVARAVRYKQEGSDRFSSTNEAKIITVSELYRESADTRIQVQYVIEQFKRTYPLIKIQLLDTDSIRVNIYGEGAKVFSEPVFVNAYINHQPEERELSEFGLEEKRDLIITFSSAILADAGILMDSSTYLIGSIISWDEDRWEILSQHRPKDGYWGNTNIPLFIVVTANRYRDGT